MRKYLRIVGILLICLVLAVFLLSTAYFQKIKQTNHNIIVKKFREIEPDNTIATANKIGLNQEIDGSLLNKNDKDFYQFSIDRLSNVHIDANNSTINHFTIIILDSHKKPIGISANVGISKQTIELALSNPGEYYLEISSNDENIKNAPYHFSIQILPYSSDN